MPQMAPLWWELLFLMFILSLMIMIMIMFYNKSLKSSINSKESNQVNEFKWKW